MLGVQGSRQQKPPLVDTYSMKVTFVPAAVVAAALAGSLCALHRPAPPDTRPDTARPAPGQPAAASLLFGRLLDLNRATAADLAALPAIGPTRAASIVEERAARGGRFDRVDDLLDVPGIGARTLDRVRPFLDVPPP